MQELILDYHSRNPPGTRSYVCVCACVYVCLYVYMYICIYVCVYVCTHIFIHIYIYVYVCMCVHIFIHIYIYVSIYIYMVLFSFLCQLYVFFCVPFPTQYTPSPSLPTHSLPSTLSPPSARGQRHPLRRRLHKVLRGSRAKFR